jgi:hypothetical protein
MSKMAELSIEINDLLEEGYLPVTVARILEVPIDWVYEASELDSRDDLSPFQTVNS